MFLADPTTSSVFKGDEVPIPNFPPSEKPVMVINVLFEFNVSDVISMKLNPPEPKPFEFIKLVSPPPPELFQVKYDPWFNDCVAKFAVVLTLKYFWAKIAPLTSSSTLGMALFTPIFPSAVSRIPTSEADTVFSGQMQKP